MPLTKTWGPLTVTRTPIAQNDPSLGVSDTESLIVISLFDCFPAPGSTTDYLKPKSVPADLITNSLTEQEHTRLGQLPTLNGSQAQTAQNIVEQIKHHMQFNAHFIDYTGDAYNALRVVHPCFTSRLSLRVYFEVSNVEITTSEAINLGTEQLKAGTTIASFRIKQAVRHRFEVDHTWNALCCPAKPPEEKESENSDDYYAIEEIIVTGERIRRLQEEGPIPVKPFTLEDLENLERKDK